MKPYQKIPILESQEPIAPIPLELFAVESPHPYQKLSAPYGDRSPYYLRQTVLAKLIEAQNQLQVQHPNWRIQIFDAYRPIEVQRFMVDYSFAELLQAQQLKLSELSETEIEKIWEQVYQFWAPPSLDPATPPPHSTGAAIDLTLVDENGNTINMGSAIDEISPVSHPDYFANSTNPLEQQYHANRQLLSNVMQKAGFQRHPNEWWHFSCGDQMWAWLCDRADPNNPVIARYGKI
ncbi:M15 family metallopeptidase [Argonema antarcticum]|uniref:M15 family metallopeptidase n=1 Tax=Argonema antarcticum TaxID=2942763 RepID=UPI002011A306|nr:M15 family metallopeptidase [Argonema antarcticum]MCL1473044.1 M15 family metallopeptidase [Argonema antarcticum A004/B2]